MEQTTVPRYHARLVNLRQGRPAAEARTGDGASGFALQVHVPVLSRASGTRFVEMKCLCAIICCQLLTSS